MKLLQVSDNLTPWAGLPAWLAYFFELGRRTAVAHEHGRKTCAVVVPPVRSFGAVFAATGAVVGVALNARSLPELEAHFRILSSLEMGTSLVVKNGQRIYAAAFKGVGERDGTPYLRIEYNGMTQQLPKSECRRVQVGKGGKRTLPKTGRSAQSQEVAVIEDILGDRADEFLSVPTVDVVLLGKLSLLAQELTSVSIRASRATDESAPLGALLRAGRFLPDGGISRSLLLSDRVSEFEMPVDDTPHVVIFDSPRALARYRSNFNHSSWITILDRCSPSLSEGADVANAEYLLRRGPAPHLDALTVPVGTEVQAFERGR